MMKKSILMSIRPKWVEKILNGEKTIEVRKQFPKDYKGWVYIYCTKNGDRLVLHRLFNGGYDFTLGKQFSYHDDDCNGKVVARFWCDKVEEISAKNIESFTKDSCLTVKQIEDYLWKNICNGYAIHISKLEIFDKPRELSEFYKFGLDEEIDKLMQENETLEYPHLSPYIAYDKCKLTKAPQNYCYVEGEE